jgi:hypothetical protein
MRTRLPGVLLLGVIVLVVVFIAGCGSSVAPKITSITPYSGPVGTTVTITGSGFGKEQGTSKVTFATTGIAEVASWSDTVIVAKVPLDLGPTGASFFVRVMVGSKGSGLYSFNLTASGSSTP